MFEVGAYFFFLSYIVQKSNNRLLLPTNKY